MQLVWWVPLAFSCFHSLQAPQHLARPVVLEMFECHYKESSRQWHSNAIALYPLEAQEMNPLLSYVKVDVARSSKVILSETPPGVLHVALGCQERCRPVRAGPKEGHENEQRAGVPLPMKRDWELTLLQPSST